MGFWKTLFGLEQKAPLRPMPPVGGDWVSPWSADVRYGLTDRSSRSMIEEGYKKNSAVFACISTLAFAFPEPALRVFRRDKDDEVIDGHPIRRLLERPNADMGEAELLSCVVTYMALGGNAYLYKARSSTGQVVELWPYHAGELWPVGSATQWIDHYVYDRGDGELQVVDKNDVIHCKWMPDPQHPGSGLAPLKTIARETDIDNELTRYLYALLCNDAMPRTALRLPETAHLSEEQYKRLKEQFTLRYGGDRRGGVAVLEGGIEIERLALDLNELAFGAIGNVSEARIAAAFRVPPIVAGLSAGLEKGTMANYKEARRQFAEDALVPLWRNVASEIEQSLRPDFNAVDVRVRFDLRQVEALTESKDKLWVRVLDAVGQQVLQVNEARSALGYDPVAGEDRFVAPVVKPFGAAAATQPLGDAGKKALPVMDDYSAEWTALAATLDAFEQLQVKTVKVHDGHGCQICREADGEIWTLEYARDHVLQHPRCKRWFEPLWGDEVTAEIVG